MGPHLKTLDDCTPAQIRVVCEQLLYTMDQNQRHSFALAMPGLYQKLFGVIPMGVQHMLARDIICDMETEIENYRGMISKLNDQLAAAVGLPEQSSASGPEQLKSAEQQTFTRE